jgi:catalase
MEQCKPVLIKVNIIKILLKKNMFFFFCNLGSAPNYFKNTFHGPDVTSREKHLEHATFESGLAARHEASEDDNYSQPRVFYQVKKKETKPIIIYMFF